MAGEEAIVVGLGVVSAIFGYFALALRDDGSEDDRDNGFGSKLSLFFFMLSILFLNLLMYALLLISQNTLTYLEAPVISIGLSIMTYGSISVVVLYFVYLLIMFIQSINGWFKEMMGKKREDDD